MKNEKQVILMFSGGRDSFLSACKLIEEGFRVYIVNFTNGWEHGKVKARRNAKKGAERIIKRYGKDKVKYLGQKDISIFFKEFFLPYFNMKPSDIKKEFGELTISQFNCLACRFSMYIWTIIKAKQMQIRYIAEGAREDQKFVMQLPIIIDEFKKFLSKYSLELLLPVYKLNSDWERKNLMLFRGFFSKTEEIQCLLGVPLKETPDKETQIAVRNFFNKIISNRSDKIINQYLESKINIDSIEKPI